MISYIVYILFIVSAICLVLSIYHIYCLFTINSKEAKFNIYKAIINKSKKLKKISKTLKSIILQITLYLMAACVITFILGLVVNNLNNQINAVINFTQTILSKDEDCPCYALCTGDEEIDSKCTYELLFGTDEYVKLIGHMTLNAQQEEEFKSIKKGKDGKAKNDFIRNHINDTMVADYKQIVGENKNFRSDDGLDRTTMTQDELKEDLIKLLSDYKVNGRNPNCECQTASFILLKRKCLGVKHYVEGWSWKTLWDPDKGLLDDSKSSGGSSSSTTIKPGNATGQYAITLDDGSYYWYHQSGSSGCTCTYCGNWSSAQWGGPSQGKHAFGTDGCAIYSLAIGVSNLAGKEITPADVLSTLESPINNGVCTTSQNYFSGRGIRRDAAVKKLATTYGLHVTTVGHNVSEIDAILDKGGYVWGSWIDAKSDWCGNGTSHFMMIRKKDGENYYCFTSCRGTCATSSGKAGAIQTMNYPINKQSVISAMTTGQLYGFWVEYKEDTSNSDIPTTSGESWYSSAAAMTVGTPTSIRVCEGTVPLYTGLPWAPTADTYFYNAKQAAEDINKYIGTQAGLPGGKYKSSGVKSTFHYGLASQEASTTLYGVTCGRFAPSPSTVDRTYCDNFKYDTWKNRSTPDRSVYGYNSRRYCAVLSDANGTKYFLPLTSVDAKAHTFPGGVCQSHVRIGGTFDAVNNLFTVDLGDTGGNVYQKWASSEIASKFDTVTVEAGGHPSIYFQNNLELYGIGSTSEFSGYTLEGFIVW